MEFSNIFSWASISFIIDVFIVSYIIYFVIKVSRDTRVMDVLKGLLLVVVLKFTSDILQLQALSWIIDQVITWGVIAIIVLFQPEIRRFLEKIGKNNLFKKKVNGTESDVEQLINALADATQYLSKRSIGALISLEIDHALKDYVHSGVLMDAAVSSQLLINIFIPNTPLHDGAVIIRNGRISAASCVLPLSEDMTIPQELGTRHRAAIGLSEVSDAMTIVVSEETGNISITHQHHLYRDVTAEQFNAILNANLVSYTMAFPEKFSVLKRMLMLFKGE